MISTTYFELAKVIQFSFNFYQFVFWIIWILLFFMLVFSIFWFWNKISKWFQSCYFCTFKSSKQHPFGFGYTSFLLSLRKPFEYSTSHSFYHNMHLIWILTILAKVHFKTSWKRSKIETSVAMHKMKKIYLLLPDIKFELWLNNNNTQKYM